jgi:prevent-host-death family protein
MKWTIAAAKRNFAELLRHAHEEPQSIFNRDRFVAAVIDAETFEAFKAWQESQRKSLGEALGELQTICREEDYSLEPVKRENRPTPFDAPE